MNRQFHVVTFEPPHSVVNLAPHVGVDSPAVRCAFEARWCKDKTNQAGGFDIHHEWPRSMGGPDEATDAQHLLYLCPVHHRRQHALVRAMVEAGTTQVATVRKYAADEMAAASYAISCWVNAGKPRIAGWECHAAVLKTG